MPDGQRYVEGVTPKQLPAPDANWSQKMRNAHLKIRQKRL
jgi:hypothetical protein